MNITAKKVTIIGGKRSGMALARLVTDLNGSARMTERDGEDCLSREFKDWAAEHKIAIEYNGHSRDFILESDLVVLSPGVRLDAPPVQWAKTKKILVLGEIEFAAQFCTKPIIAVTGSNGKTTVSTLITEILHRAGYNARLCGNVGFPFSDFVLRLEDIDYVVLEVSSFQLESLLDPFSKYRNVDVLDPLHVDGFQPYIAVILNFNDNHLDRHRDLEEYLSAKKRIFLNQDSTDYLVLNNAQPEIKELSCQTRSQTVYFNTPSQDPLIKNPNYSAALGVGKILNISEQTCRAAFMEFKGVEHRLEKVRRLNGVDFINDSKATTAQAALWALENIHQPILMICGGRDKNIDFSILVEPVQQRVKKMFVIGEARAKIRQAFNDLISLEECEGLEEAVKKARQNASAGDCVLLSPMCASFDMFKDFEERGRVFKSIVNRLK
jgi:UDP-N-acetylmuramoylalanine--D-glutamate ligase